MMYGWRTDVIRMRNISELGRGREMSAHHRRRATTNEAERSKVRIRVVSSDCTLSFSNNGVTPRTMSKQWGQALLLPPSAQRFCVEVVGRGALTRGIPNPKWVF